MQCKFSLSTEKQGMSGDGRADFEGAAMMEPLTTRQKSEGMKYLCKLNAIWKYSQEILHITIIFYRSVLGSHSIRSPMRGRFGPKPVFSSLISSYDKT